MSFIGSSKVLLVLHYSNEQQFWECESHLQVMSPNYFVFCVLTEDSILSCIVVVTFEIGAPFWGKRAFVCILRGSELWCEFLTELDRIFFKKRRNM